MVGELGFPIADHKPEPADVLADSRQVMAAVKAFLGDVFTA
jgi:hypothetical protein